MWKNKNKTLRGVNIWISGALPEKEIWPHPLYDRDILTFVAQLSRLVFMKGGSIIHGSHPSFTPILVHQHAAVSPEKLGYLKLFVSDFFGSEVYEKYSTSCDVSVVPCIEADGDKTKIEKSLTALRYEMARKADIMVVLGGKVHADGLREPGVFEEIRIAHEYGVRTYVLPNFKGATQLLDEEYAKDRIVIDETDLDFLAHMLVKKVEGEFSLSLRLIRMLKKILST